MSIELPDTPAGRAASLLVDVLNGGGTDALAPILAPWLRETIDDAAVAALGAALRPVRVERHRTTFERRLDLLLGTADGPRLCMVGTDEAPPQQVAFLQIRPISGAAWQPTPGNRFVDRMRNELELVGLATARIDGDATSFESVGGVDERSVFRVGSVSKPMTAIGVHQLVDDGLLALDDPLDPLLPDVDVPAGVTVGHVVEHRSGLVSDAPIGVDAGAAVPTIPELVAASPLRLGFEPGTQHAYSNIGSGLLGHLIATVRGAAFEDVMRDRVFLPLGMSDTGYIVGHVDASRLAPGRQSILGLVSDVPWTEVTVPGAGSLLSTAADLACFCRAALDGAVPLVAWVEDGDRRRHSGAWDGYAATVLLDRGRCRAAVLLTNTDNITHFGGLFDAYAPKLLDEPCRVD